MIEAISKTIDVPCSQQQAFETFVSGMDSWWPKDKASVSAMNGEVARSVSIESKEGGKISEVGHDGVEHHWGSVASYNPFSFLAMNWHIGTPASMASLVEVSFIVLGDDSTRVELKHSNWEALGEKGPDMRNSYNTGWVGVFEHAFKQACSG